MTNLNSAIRWNMVRQASNGLCYLSYLEIEPEDTGTVIFTKIQQHRLLSRQQGRQNMSSFLYAPVVYIVTAIRGTASTNSNDVEAQDLVREVFIKSKRYSEAYTLALRDPARFEKEKAPDFLINRPNFGLCQGSDQVVHALLVVQEIRRAKVVGSFVLLSIFSIAMGMVVGLTSRKPNLGIMVTADLFQLLAMLQWSYIWAAKR